MVEIQQDILNKLKRVERDIDFEALEQCLKTSNIFRILRVTKTEIRHSNFLAWLLDPSESHNLREVFLNKFMQDLDIETDNLKYQKVEIFREWNNVDLLIVLEDDVICIENKIMSGEHSNQLMRYKKIVNRNFKNRKTHFVFLTPYGASASDKDYCCYSFEQIAEGIQYVISVYRRNLTSEVIQYLRDYVDILKMDIIKEHELNEKAFNIYKRHKEAFDFIFENRPDYSDEVKSVLIERILAAHWKLGSKGKKYVRFITPGLHDILPKLMGWKMRESFLFEFYINKNSMGFQSVIAPGSKTDNDEAIRYLLEEILLSVNGTKASTGDKWLVNFHRQWSIQLNEFSSSKSSEIEELVDDFWHEIEGFVNAVEVAFLSRKQELSVLKV